MKNLVVAMVLGFSALLFGGCAQWLNDSAAQDDNGDTDPNGDPVVCSRDANCPDPLSQSCIDSYCQDDEACDYQLFLFDASTTTYDSVSVAGSFNEWSATAWPMAYLEEEGLWYAKRYLSDGHYTYKLVTNGTEWITDPENPLTEADSYSGQNSVLDVLCAGCGELS
ncbi:hypothetical protein KAI87_16635, partial [Myxococcota bacterium]|nr:hypothetical protein [Myxococcota bacterium]